MLSVIPLRDSTSFRILFDNGKSSPGPESPSITDQIDNMYVPTARDLISSSESHSMFLESYALYVGLESREINIQLGGYADLQGLINQSINQRSANSTLNPVYYLLHHLLLWPWPPRSQVS